jgi:hypothetical protein
MQRVFEVISNFTVFVQQAISIADCEYEGNKAHESRKNIER